MGNKKFINSRAELSGSGSAGREIRQEAPDSMLAGCEGRHLVG